MTSVYKQSFVWLLFLVLGVRAPSVACQFSAVVHGVTACQTGKNGSIRFTVSGVGQNVNVTTYDVWGQRLVNGVWQNEYGFSLAGPYTIIGQPFTDTLPCRAGQVRLAITEPYTNCTWYSATYTINRAPCTYNIQTLQITNASTGVDGLIKFNLSGASGVGGDTLYTVTSEWDPTYLNPSYTWSAEKNRNYYHYKGQDTISLPAGRHRLRIADAWDSSCHVTTAPFVIGAGACTWTIASTGNRPAKLNQRGAAYFDVGGKSGAGKAAAYYTVFESLDDPNYTGSTYIRYSLVPHDSLPLYPGRYKLYVRDYLDTAHACQSSPIIVKIDTLRGPCSLAITVLSTGSASPGKWGAVRFATTGESSISNSPYYYIKVEQQVSGIWGYFEQPIYYSLSSFDTLQLPKGNYRMQMLDYNDPSCKSAMVNFSVGSTPCSYGITILSLSQPPQIGTGSVTFHVSGSSGVNQGHNYRIKLQGKSGSTYSDYFITGFKNSEPAQDNLSGLDVGTYRLMLVDNGDDACTPVSPDFTIALPGPNQCLYPTLSFSNNVLTAAVPSGGAYQWYLNGAAIQGATATTYTITTSGSYTFSVTYLLSLNSYCTATSSPYVATYVAPNSAPTWVRLGSSDSLVRFNRVRQDLNGNSYAAGAFRRTTAFDGLSGGASQSYTASGGLDGMLCRYNRTGVLQWVARFNGAAGDDEVLGLATDKFGYAYVSGYFAGTMTINTTSSSATTLTSAGLKDAFVAKIHPNGSLMYAYRFGASGNDQANGVDVAPDLRLYVAGSFIGATAIGGISGTVVSLTSRGNSDAFLAKFSDIGTLYWVIQGGGPGNDFGYGAAADITGGGYLMGSYEGTASFNSSLGGTTPLTRKVVGGSDGFVLGVSVTGTLNWVATMGGTTNENVRDVAPDPRGTGLVAVGGFSGKAYFGTDSLTSRGYYDAFAVRLSNLGAFQWVRKAGGFGQDQAYGVRLDLSGNALVAFTFTQSAFTFGGAANTLTSTGGQDGMLTKLAAATGLPYWSRQISGPGDESVFGVDTAEAGGVLAAGQMANNAVFGLNYGPYAVQRGFNGWLAKYALGNNARLGDEYGVSRDVAAASSGLLVYPNPSTGAVTVQLTTHDEADVAVEIWTTTGQRILQRLVPASSLQAGLMVNLPAPGIYQMRVGSNTVRVVSQ